jgi:hypothetical protein
MPSHHAHTAKQCHHGLASRQLDCTYSGTHWLLRLKRAQLLTVGLVHRPAPESRSLVAFAAGGVVCSCRHKTLGVLSRMVRGLFNHFLMNPLALPAAV